MQLFVRRVCSKWILFAAAWSPISDFGAHAARFQGVAGLGSPSNLDNLSMMICPILADCVVKAPSKTFGNLSSPRVPIEQRALFARCHSKQIGLIYSVIHSFHCVFVRSFVPFVIDVWLT